MSFGDYKAIVFDCDGVVLDSNRIKTEAFYHAALPYGEQAARALVDYHIQNGGISRYQKFKWFLMNAVEGGFSEGKLTKLLTDYGEKVREQLKICDVAPGLDQLRKLTSNARWFLVSGGDQDELRDVFALRGLSELFDGGIFGSPDTKDEILSREIKSGNLSLPALFLGDSRYDYAAASKAGLDFIFLSGWSEVKEWESWVKDNRIMTYSNIAALVGEKT